LADIETVVRMKIRHALTQTPAGKTETTARVGGTEIFCPENRCDSKTPNFDGPVSGHVKAKHYSAAEKKLLLELARKALICAAANHQPPEIHLETLPPKLVEEKACFVTLREDGALRGCLGQIRAQMPLCLAVAENARQAATRDWRFPPVERSEVDRIKIEISVLTEPQPLAFSSPEELLGKLRSQEDGVLLEIGSRRATFLPQVWNEVSNKVEFMERLAQKTGCEPSAWRGGDATVSVYHVEAFEE
jgi:AmmeMemoRadiSam system protein A